MSCLEPDIGTCELVVATSESFLDITVAVVRHLDQILHQWFQLGHT